MVPQRIYLDTNQLYGWFENQLNRKKPESGIVKFLGEKCKDMEKLISVYSVAELLVNLKRDFQNRDLTAKKLEYLFVILKDIIGIKIILESKITREIIGFADLCNDHNDAVHIQIAKNQDLTLVTKDEKIGRVKPAYPNVMSIGKLMKQFA